MANYRFKTAEIEAMKKKILTHIEREAETKTAWRLRCAIEGLLMCCRPSKREAARLERELALYEKLTKNDLPNWQSEPTQPATPTETPQISTETEQITNQSTDTPKPRETARKPQNRGIGNTRHSRLGANGYAMLDNASATLTAMHVSRECSTADYW